MDLGLTGKVAVVTGGTAGIGLATAQAFINEGAYVAVCGRHSETLLAEALQQLGDKAFGCQTDMTNENEVYGFARQVNDHFGHIDIWVNNVGASFARKDKWYAGKKIDAHYAVNFKSVVMGSQAAIPYLEKQGGVIIDVSFLGCPLCNVWKGYFIWFDESGCRQLYEYISRRSCTQEISSIVHYAWFYLDAFGGWTHCA